MKTLILTLAVLMAIPFVANSSTRHSQVISGSLELAEVQPILGIGTPKYNKRKLTRQNTIGKTNSRAKKLQRKNGIGMLLLTNSDHVC